MDTGDPSSPPVASVLGMDIRDKNCRSETPRGEGGGGRGRGYSASPKDPLRAATREPPPLLLTSPITGTEYLVRTYSIRMGWILTQQGGRALFACWRAARDTHNSWSPTGRVPPAEAAGQREKKNVSAASCVQSRGVIQDPGTLRRKGEPYDTQTLPLLFLIQLLDTVSLSSTDADIPSLGFHQTFWVLLGCAGRVPRGAFIVGARLGRR